MSALPEIPSEPVHPKQWPPHPVKRMVMTPLLVTIGAMLVFCLVVAMVVVLPTTTFEPPPSENWRPMSQLEEQGRTVFLQNGCIYCHSGFTRPQDLLASQYYVYTRVSEPGDFMGEGDSPNTFGTARTGPDLSQSGGFHPDDWHYAHYNNPRFVTPFSVMPRFNFLSESEVAALVAYTQSRGGKLADLRSQYQQSNKALEMASFNVEAATCPNDPCPDGFPAASAMKNLMLVERGYWFSDNPLPVTTENLLRGRQIFQERCIGCHGSAGDGNGPGADYLMPSPADFTSPDDQCCGSDTSPGAYYWRILRGLPGSAMENFGTRLSVDDIWKVVLFLKTIPNGGLEKLPTPDMYVQWKGYPGLYQWANCFMGEETYFANIDMFRGAPAGAGDVPGIVGIGQVNPVYAVVQWEVNNNARPCTSGQHANVTFLDIMNEAAARQDGYARQGVDQTQFIPASMLDQTQIPPLWLNSVWPVPVPTPTSAPTTPDAARTPGATATAAAGDTPTAAGTPPDSATPAPGASPAMTPTAAAPSS
jgi:cbb3-type cytochrome c oxidase subunit II